MKNLIATLALCGLITFGCSSQQTAAEPKTETEPTTNTAQSTPVEGEQVNMTVYGLSCPLCAANVDKQLAKLPGVKNVIVDLEFGFITVDIDPKQPPTREELAKAVVDSGFTLKSFD